MPVELRLLHGKYAGLHPAQVRSYQVPTRLVTLRNSFRLATGMTAGRPRQCVFLPFVCLTLLLSFPVASVAQTFEKADLDFFERRVRPVLVERCVKCHGPAKQESLSLIHI